MERAQEKEILEAVQAGRKERFEAIVKLHQRRAFRIAMGLVQNAQDSMDLAQEAFLRAFRSIKTFDTDQPFFPWFYRILRNLCLTHLKRRRKVFSLSGSSRTNDDEDRVLDVPSDGERPDERAETQETVGRFYEAFKTLGDRDREILTLRHFEDMAYSQIAETLRIPVGTVMSRLFYARRKLRGKLEEDLDV